jgi:hypothetical protein
MTETTSLGDQAVEDTATTTEETSGIIGPDTPADAEQAARSPPEADQEQIFDEGLRQRRKEESRGGPAASVIFSPRLLFASKAKDCRKPMVL